MSLSTQIAFLSFVAFSRLKVILAVTDISLAIQSPDAPRCSNCCQSRFECRQEINKLLQCDFILKSGKEKETFHAKKG